MKPDDAYELRWMGHRIIVSASLAAWLQQCKDATRPLEGIYEAALGRTGGEMDPKPIPWADIKVSCSPPDVVARGEARAQATLQAEEGGASASDRYAIDAFVRGIIDSARANNLRDSRIAELESTLWHAKERVEHWREHSAKLEARAAQQLHEIDSAQNKLEVLRKQRAELLDDLQETAQNWMLRAESETQARLMANTAARKLVQVEKELAEARGYIAQWSAQANEFWASAQMLGARLDAETERADGAGRLVAELEAQNRELAEARVTADVEAQQLRAQRDQMLRARPNLEWLCKGCNEIYPTVSPGKVLQPCPRCSYAMSPTSRTLRDLDDARREIEGLKNDVRTAEAHADAMTQKVADLQRTMLDAVAMLDVRKDEA